jgi:hypothetical protein
MRQQFDTVSCGYSFSYRSTLKKEARRRGVPSKLHGLTAGETVPFEVNIFSLMGGGIR